MATRYVQNHVQAEAHHPHGQDARYFDVIDEFWLPNGTAFQALTPLAADHPIRGFEAEVLTTERTRAFVATMVANIP